MKTITTRGTVTRDGHLFVPVTKDVPVGEHDVVVVIDERMMAAALSLEHSKLPIHDCGAWPAGLSLRREDLYDDWGR